MFRCEARRPQEDGWRREGRASPPQVGHLWKLFAQISIIWSWKLYLKVKCEKNPSFYSRFYKWTFQSFCNLEKCFIHNSIEYFLYFSSLDQIVQQSCFDSVYPRSVEEAFLQIRRSFLFTVPSHTIFPFHSFSLITLGNYITTRLSGRQAPILYFNF